MATKKQPRLAKAKRTFNPLEPMKYFENDPPIIKLAALAMILLGVAWDRSEILHLTKEILWQTIRTWWL